MSRWDASFWEADNELFPPQRTMELAESSCSTHTNTHKQYTDTHTHTHFIISREKNSKLLSSSLRSGSSTQAHTRKPKQWARSATHLCSRAHSPEVHAEAPQHARSYSPVSVGSSGASCISLHHSMPEDKLLVCSCWLATAVMASCPPLSQALSGAEASSITRTHTHTHI